MTPHSHSKVVDGCYRCELGADEIDEDVPGRVIGIDFAERNGGTVVLLVEVDGSTRWGSEFVTLTREGATYGMSIAEWLESSR